MLLAPQGIELVGLFVVKVTVAEFVFQFRNQPVDGV